MSDQHDFSPVRAFDENGFPVPGAKMYAYIVGTTSPVDIFADQAETILHPTPLLANAAGVFPPVWRSNVFKAVVTDASDATLPGYPMEIAMRSFGGSSDADSISFTPVVGLSATNVQDAIELAFSQNDTRLDALGDLAALDAITTAQIAPSALRIAAEGVGTPLDTEVPTVALMTAHVASTLAAKGNKLPDLVYGPFPLALADARTFAHGLVSPPRRIEFWIRCLTASAGMVVLEEYGPISPTATADGVNIGFAAVVNTTQLKTVTGQASIQILDITNGQRVSLAGILGNFSYFIYAWA